MVTTTSNKVLWRIATVLLVGFVAWWAYLQLYVPKENLQYQIFGSSYGVLALYGGALGLIASKAWGGLRSVLGRAIAFFALGLLAQEFGQLVYSYYTYFSHTEIPYPSLGDLGYFGSIPLYIAGAWQLAQAAGAKFSLRTIGKKLLALFIPGVILAISYVVFLKGYEFNWSQPLTIFLDFGYPLGQAIYISIAILAYMLSRKLLGGMMRGTILLVIFALAVQYGADFAFLYMAHQQTAYAGGINDLIYLVSYFLMTISLLKFGKAYGRIKG